MSNDLSHIMKNYDYTRVVTRMTLPGTRQLWYDLCFVLLSQSVPESMAYCAIRRLNDLGLLKRPNRALIKKALSDPQVCYENQRRCQYRHPDVGDEIESAIMNFHIFLPLLSSNRTPSVLREWLVENISGFGYAHATQYLMTIGQAGDLVMIDDRMLEVMLDVNLLGGIPNQISDDTYKVFENMMRAYILGHDLHIDTFVRAVWKTNPIK